MGTRTFIESRGLKLTSDERDIMIPAGYRDDVVQWCEQHGIDASRQDGDYNHSVAKLMFKVDLWRVLDEKQRIWFLLRWS